MSIIPELSKNELKVLIFLSTRSATPSEISREIGLPLSKVSVAVKKLIKTGILKQRKGYASVSLDVNLKSVIRGFLADFSENMFIEVFFGARLNVLLQISENYDTMEKLDLITGCPNRTLKRILKQLQDALLIYQPKLGAYKVRDTYKDKINLLKSTLFSHYLDLLTDNGIDYKEFRIFGNFILIESLTKSIPGFVRTGFSRFHEYKVGLIMTDYDYFVNSDKEQEMEEIFIHALAVSKTDYRGMLYCTLFADLNNLTLNKLKSLPIIFKVENEAKQIFDYLASKGGTKSQTDYLTPYREYLEVRGDYARY